MEQEKYRPGKVWILKNPLYLVQPRQRVWGLAGTSRSLVYSFLIQGKVKLSRVCSGQVCTLVYLQSVLEGTINLKPWEWDCSPQYQLQTLKKIPLLRKKRYKTQESGPVKTKRDERVKIWTRHLLRRTNSLNGLKCDQKENMPEKNN